MSMAQALASYVDAFNRGDATGYAAFYAPDIELRNGRGMVLRGPEAITAFYSAFRQRVARVMRLVAVAEGTDALAASLASRFTALTATEFSGDHLAPGDSVEIESIALYELADGKFARITATTTSRRIVRKGEGQ